MRPMLSILLAAAAIATTARAADKDGVVDVGGKAPGFTLTDQNGEAVELAKLAKPDRYVAIVFHRSASW